MNFQKPMRGYWVMLALGGLYFAVGRLTGALVPELPVGSRALLPPTGIGLAMLLLCGYRAWPALSVASLGVSLSLHASPLVSLVAAASSTVECLFGAWLTRRFAGGEKFYEQPRNVMGFALLAGGVSPLVGPPILLNESYTGLAGLLQPIGQIWLLCWLADLVSVLIFTPALVSWVAGPRVGWTRSAGLELGTLFLLLSLMGAAVFGRVAPAFLTPFLLPFLCLPFLKWAAFRFSQRETSLATLWLGVLALYGIGQGHAFFVEEVPSQSVFAYLEFMAVSAVIALVMSAVISQRRQDREALKEAKEGLELRVQERTAALEAEVAQRKGAELALQESHDQLERRVQQRTRELQQSNEALAKEIAQRAETQAALQRTLRRLVDVQETERSRVARELHDQMAQDLTAIKLGLGLLRMGEFAPVDPGERLREMEVVAENMMRDVHRLVLDLRPPALDDFGLELALQRYCTEWSERTRVRLDFNSIGLEVERIPRQLETALYRVAQEALTNVRRHAVAKRVSVLLDRRVDRISLIIEDNGRGFEPPAGGFDGRQNLGLRGMEERIALVEGTFQIESSPGKGTTIIARIPLPNTRQIPARL